MQVFEGNIRKMRSKPADRIEYQLPFYDKTTFSEAVDITPLIGHNIRLTYNNRINCVVTGKKIKKAYGEGMSYDAFMNSPQASPSIIRPELSRIHEGIALRDYDWEMEHHNQPHVVYLSLTNEIKVGVTRTVQIPTRWIDQGATQAIILAETPYRQAAGLIEVALKDHLADKTNWRKMLMNVVTGESDLVAKKKAVLQFVPEALKEFISPKNTIHELNYPVLEYPVKVKSVKLDKLMEVEKKLTGIKGQYLIFSDGCVLNIRSHAGYHISLYAD